MAKVYPSLRERRRYLLINWGGEKEDFRKIFRKYFGIFYEAKARIKTVEVGQYTVVSVRRGFEDLVRATIVLHTFKNNPFVERVTGTMKKMEEYLRQKSDQNLNI